jgi:hypothetical protein
MTDVTPATAEQNLNIVTANTVQINPQGQILQSVQNAITAHSGGGQANAVQLNAMACFIATVAVAGDSVVLPHAQPGMEISVINQSATATGPNVFPATGETINALSANTAIAVGPQSILMFYCGVAGSWWTK